MQVLKLKSEAELGTTWSSDILSALRALSLIKKQFAEVVWHARCKHLISNLKTFTYIFFCSMREHWRLAVIQTFIMVIALHALYKLLSCSTKHAVCHLFQKAQKYWFPIFVIMLWFDTKEQEKYYTYIQIAFILCQYASSPLMCSVSWKSFCQNHSLTRTLQSKTVPSQFNSRLKEKMIVLKFN